MFSGILHSVWRQRASYLARNHLLLTRNCYSSKSTRKSAHNTQTSKLSQRPFAMFCLVGAGLLIGGYSITNHSQKYQATLLSSLYSHGSNSQDDNHSRDVRGMLQYCLGLGVNQLHCRSVSDNSDKFNLSDPNQRRKYCQKRLFDIAMSGDLQQFMSQLEQCSNLFRKYNDEGEFSLDVDRAHDEGGWNLLHVASMNGNLELATWLLDNGADPNSRQLFPPFIPEKKSNPDMKMFEMDSMHVPYLIELVRSQYHRSIDIRDYYALEGLTPLHCAVLGGNAEVVRLLVDRGADSTIKTRIGKLARDYCTEYRLSYCPNSNVSSPSTIHEILDLADSIARRSKLQSERRQRLKFPLEQHLRNHIVGQDAPIEAVGSAYRRKLNGWEDEGRPLVFLFLGSSGIGKTELAKQLADYVKNTPGNTGGSSNGKEDDGFGFIRIDMSEFQSKHEVARFLGSPPGYRDHDKGGQLTSRLQKYPNAVVLLDEVEKAHIDVLTVMLQVFDEGRLTDGKGETVNCKNAIFIMTSNLGQREIAEEAERMRQMEQKVNEESDTKDNNMVTQGVSREFIDGVMYPILRRHFQRDEFLGRINETLYFLPFTDSELNQLVSKQMEKWSERAMKRHEIKLTWDQEVVESLRKDYDSHYGARSIQNSVKRKVINLLADAHERGDIVEGSSVHVFIDPRDQSVTFTHIPPHTSSDSDGGKSKRSSGIFSGLWRKE